MLVLKRQNSEIIHDQFANFINYLDGNDLLVLNNTRVIPARLIGKIKGEDKAVELLLLNRLASGNWMAMVKPGRRLKPGRTVTLNLGVEAIIIAVTPEGLREISFTGPKPFDELLDSLGEVPLPPYIKKQVQDPEQYQTIYALEKGSAAAPTAGFHFTENVFSKLEQKGVERLFITLHIGPGTFQPVKVDDIREHRMHSEYFRIDRETADCINRAKAKNKRIIAVGTTVCRVLEAVASSGQPVQPQEGWTDLYIYPGFRFHLVDAMLTNFHLPKSSLLMLVSALAGRETILRAYQAAVREQYRFFSFGDCMFIT